MHLDGTEVTTLCQTLSKCRFVVIPSIVLHLAGYLVCIIITDNNRVGIHETLASKLVDAGWVKQQSERHLFTTVNLKIIWFRSLELVIILTLKWQWSMVAYMPCHIQMKSSQIPVIMRHNSWYPSWFGAAYIHTLPLSMHTCLTCHRICAHMWHNGLTLWGRMAHVLVDWVIIASGNGMSHQAIGWTNANLFVNRMIVLRWN